MLLVTKTQGIYSQIGKHAAETRTRSGTYFDPWSNRKRRWAVGVHPHHQMELIFVYYPESNAWVDDNGEELEGYVPEGHRERVDLTPHEEGGLFRR